MGTSLFEKWVVMLGRVTVVRGRAQLKGLDGKFVSTSRSVSIMLWLREHRVFAAEVHFSNSHSVIAVQRAFRRHFEIPPQSRVPDSKSISSWVDAFREAGNVSKRKKGPTKTVTTPENVERVRQSMLQSPKRSARKHAVALGMSGRLLR